MSAFLKLTITATLLATAIASPSNAAEVWFNPGGGLSPGAQAITARGPPTVGSVPFRDLSGPNYQSRTVITSSFGTSVYTYRSYSR